MKVWLLPGMDGTGDLFLRLVGALSGLRTQVVRHPRDATYDSLRELLAER